MRSALSRTAFALAAALMLLTACGEDASDEVEGGAPDTSSPAAPSPSPGQRRSGTLSLASGESVDYWCAGEGSQGCCSRPGPTPGAPMPTPRRSSTRWWPRRRCAPTTVRAQGAVTHRPTGVARCTTVRGPGRGAGEFRCLRRTCSSASPGRQPQHRLRGPSPERVAGLVTIDSYHDDPEDLRAEGFVWTDNPESWTTSTTPRSWTR